MFSCHFISTTALFDGKPKISILNYSKCTNAAVDYPLNPLPPGLTCLSYKTDEPALA